MNLNKDQVSTLEEGNNNKGRWNTWTLYDALEKANEPSTEELKVWSSANLGDKGMEMLATVLGKKKKRDGHVCLRRLDLERCGIGPHGIEWLVKNIAGNYTLKYLTLEHNEIGSRGAKLLADLLKQQPNRPEQQQLAGLRSLDLGRNCIGDEGAVMLGLALRTNKTLQVLNLAGNQIGDDGAEALSLGLAPDASQLFNLSLAGNYVSTNGATALAHALKKNIHLEKLSLKCNPIGDLGAEKLAIALQENRTLVDLDLRSSHIGYLGGKAIADALENNCILTAISLSWNDLSDKGVALFANALAKNTTWKALDFRFDGLETSDIYLLLGALEQNSTLQYFNGIKRGQYRVKAISVIDALVGLAMDVRELDVSAGAKVGDFGCELLGNALRRSESVKRVTLNSNNISCEGAIQLADALSMNQSLEFLDLSENNIRDAGGRAIADMLKVNTTLVTLNLKFNSLGNEGLQAISHSLQHMQASKLDFLAIVNNGFTTGWSEPLLTAFQQNLFLVTRIDILESHCFGEYRVKNMQAKTFFEAQNCIHHHGLIRRIRDFL